ncbi:hypothetical protein F5879DRAFT_404293 [Lentinula edodes]|nr:hypothetical protein F5879DRAFT_404293 [Lentinula edodes]
MPHPAVAAIIGSAVGGTIFLILIIALVLWYRHYKRRPRMLKQYVSSSRSWDYDQDETRIEPFPLQPLRRLPLESHSTNNLNPQRSETSVTYPSTIITGVTGSSYHMTSEGYSSPPALDANFALPATTVRFAENTTTSETSSNSRSRNRRVDTATPSSSAGRSSRRANNGSTATSSSAPSSTHSSRKREIRELRRTVEDLKRQQQEMLARLPPSYTDISNQGLG